MTSGPCEESSLVNWQPLPGDEDAKMQAVAEKSNFVGGTICLIGLLATWETMGVVLQGLTYEYPKYGFMACVLRIGYLIPLLLWVCIQKWYRRPIGNRITKRAIIVSCICAILGYFAGYLWYLSLNQTLVAANNAIYQATPFFVFLLSVCFLNEKATWLKLFAFVLCGGGVALVAVYTGSKTTDGQLQTSTPAGYLLEVASTAFYAILEVVFAHSGPKSFPRDGSVANGLFFLGLCGVWTLLIFPPFVVILDYTGVEKFEFPKPEILNVLFLNLGLETVFNIFLYIGIAFSGPVCMSVGCILLVPIGIVVDWIMSGTLLSPKSLIGCALILVGFSLLEGASCLRACRGIRVGKRADYEPLHSQVSTMYLDEDEDEEDAEEENEENEENEERGSDALV